MSSLFAVGEKRYISSKKFFINSFLVNILAMTLLLPLPDFPIHSVKEGNLFIIPASIYDDCGKSLFFVLSACTSITESIILSRRK